MLLKQIIKIKDELCTQKVVSKLLGTKFGKMPKREKFLILAFFIGFGKMKLC